MILSDREIQEYVGKKDLIFPFVEEQVTPNGYDLSIEEAELINGSVEKIENNDGTIEIPSKKSFIVLTKEAVSLPEDITGRLQIKTKFARRGIVGSFGEVDAGFAGKLNLCFFNGNDEKITLEKGKPMVQIIFERMEEKSEKAYEERSGNYQNQDKIIK
jgi:dCTP deaminase